MDSSSSSSPAPSTYVSVPTKPPVDLDKITKIPVEDDEKTRVGGKWANNLLDSKSATNLSFMESYETAENTYSSFLNFEINNPSPKILPTNYVYEILNENSVSKSPTQILTENGKYLSKLLRLKFYYYNIIAEFILTPIAHASIKF
jgi:hypothetical protein